MSDRPDLWQMLRGPIQLPDDLLQALIGYHLQPVRYYHNIQHVISVLEDFRMLHSMGLWSHPEEVHLAILYHDSIYAYGAADNEQRSAVLAVCDAQRWLGDHGLNLEYVHRLIILTASHGSEPEHLSAEEALFLDCDMAIIGSDWRAFDEYQRQIEQEYTQVYTRPMYRAGRHRFLNRLYKSERIFFSDHFHQRLNEQARTNLQRALHHR